MRRGETQKQLADVSTANLKLYYYDIKDMMERLQKIDKDLLNTYSWQFKSTLESAIETELGKRTLNDGAKDNEY